MKTEVNPQDTNRAEAFELWMSSPMKLQFVARDQRLYCKICLGWKSR